jgi:hypothetical protein
VTTIELSDELQRLHDRLRQSLRDVGAESIEPAYNGTGYRPHITDTWDGRAVGPGERILLTALAILDCTQPVRVLTAHAAFSRST